MKENERKWKKMKEMKNDGKWKRMKENEEKIEKKRKN